MGGALKLLLKQPLLIVLQKKAQNGSPILGFILLPPLNYGRGQQLSETGGRNKTQRTAKKFDMSFVGLGENAVSVDELEQRRVFLDTLLSHGMMVTLSFQ